MPSCEKRKLPKIHLLSQKTLDFFGQQSVSRDQSGAEDPGICSGWFSDNTSAERSTTAFLRNQDSRDFEGFLVLDSRFRGNDTPVYCP